MTTLQRSQLKSCLLSFAKEVFSYETARREAQLELVVAAIEPRVDQWVGEAVLGWPPIGPTVLTLSSPPPPKEDKEKL